MATVQLLAYAIAVGVGATVAMDVWNLFLKRLFGVQSLDYCLLGRWVAHMPRGTFVHTSVAAADVQKGECTLGWLVHYSIGVALAVVFVTLVPDSWPVRPTLLPPLVFGVITVVFPFVILQPSIGLGIAASRARHPARARAKSVLTHAVFGLGLYLSALLVRQVLG